MILSTTHALKVPVVCRSEYTLSLEQPLGHAPFIHCDIHVPWSPSVLGKLREDWALLCSLRGGPLRALHVPGDRKHLKFITLFGFRKLDSFTDDLGRPRDIYTT